MRAKEVYYSNTSHIKRAHHPAKPIPPENAGEMSGRRPDGSYGPEYGPLPPEHEHALCHHLPSRGRAPWALYHGDYHGRLLEQRVRREFGLARPHLRPYAPLRILHFREGGGSGSAAIHRRPRREDRGLTDNEFRKAMEQLEVQTFRPSNLQKTASRRGGRGRIFHSRSARTEAAPGSEEEKAACTICLETFLPGQEVAVTPCSHMFHHGCITPWVKGHGNCPVCRFMLCERRNVVTDDIQGDDEGGEVDLDLLAMMRAMEEAFSRLTLRSFMSYH